MSQMHIASDHGDLHIFFDAREYLQAQTAQAVIPAFSLAEALNK